MVEKIKFGISKNKRTFTPTPIVQITEKNGKEVETFVLVVSTTFGKKKKGDELSEKIVKLLNSEENGN